MSARGKRPVGRREFLRYITMGAGAALLAACQPAPTPTPKAAPATAAPAATPSAQAAATPLPKTTSVAKAKTIKVLLGPYHPTEWTQRTAEHPVVSNALRIVAKRFEELNPGVNVEFATNAPGYGGTTGGEQEFMTWLTAQVASGEVPEIVFPLHDIPIQNGWAVPLDEYLAQPNPYAPKYKAWKDIFYPGVMKTLIYADGRTYCAPLRSQVPGLDVGMVYNKDILTRAGLKPPATWTEQLELNKKLKSVGSGAAPWPVESKSGNCWALAVQLLPPLLQGIGPDMDQDKDFNVGAPEALPAFRKGLIGPLTPAYQVAWREMKKLADSWIDGWQTTDCDLLFRQGKVGLQYRLGSEFSALGNDPTLAFERGFIPTPVVTSKDVPGAKDPDNWTPGDGKLPADIVQSALTADTCILSSPTTKHGTLAEAINFLQFITTPENIGFIMNENQTYSPSSPDAPLGSIWRELYSFRLPIYKYTITWWGEGLFFDATHFDNWRKLFMSWVTGQIDEKTFFARQQQEMTEGADRYEAAQKKLKEKQ